MYDETNESIASASCSGVLGFFMSTESHAPIASPTPTVNGYDVGTEEAGKVARNSLSVLESELPHGHHDRLQFHTKPGVEAAAHVRVCACLKVQTHHVRLTTSVSRCSRHDHGAQKPDNIQLANALLQLRSLSKLKQNGVR